MHMDIVDLRQFYATPLGQLAQRQIEFAIKALWKPISKERLAGLGYTTAFLDLFRADTERTIALMPARQGPFTGPLASPAPHHWFSTKTCPCPIPALTG